jgi:hypothetical protein
VTQLLTREQAQKIVDEHIFYVGDCKAVSFESCRVLLGADRFLMLLGDPIRNKGPQAQTVYPWNVVDYLCNEDPRPNRTKEVAQ